MAAPRLSDDAVRVLARAGDEARRRGHAEVEALHVLASLAATPEHGRALRARALDRDELRMLVEAALAARGEARSYRDGSPSPPIAAGLEEGMRRARSSLFARLFAVDVEDLLDAATLDAEAYALLRRASAAIEPLHDALRRIEAAGAVTSVEHVLFALAEERWLVAATRAAGGDPDRLREVLADGLASREGQEAAHAAAAELSSLVHATLAHAKVLRRRAGCDLFVVRAVQTPRVAALFERAGVRPASLLGVLVHGEVVVDDDAIDVPPGARVEVLFHDDDVTTMDLVVELLVTCFDLGEAEATQAMLEVHGRGLGVVATLAAEDARARVALAREAARAHRAPLRISIRRAR